MILLIGGGHDPVIRTLGEDLRRTRTPHVMLDQEGAAAPQISVGLDSGRPEVRVDVGGGCKGRRVGAVFLRHAVPARGATTDAFRLFELQHCVNRSLSMASCLVVNRPERSLSNYSKPHQVRLLARAGFAVPRTLVTNVPAEARRFYEECGREVIYKGVSNSVTLARVLDGSRLDRLDLLPHCPTLFQEYVKGVDYRVHVVGEETFVTRLESRDEDYRRALRDGADVRVTEGVLPEAILSRSVDVTRELGLVVSGIDFKQRPDGEVVALEVNPFPQLSYYERAAGQPITRTLARTLQSGDPGISNVYV